MYKTELSHEIINRFFTALDQLKADKQIRGRQTFSTRYGINKRNMYKCMKEPASGCFEPAWLSYLCRDYNINANWLLVGRGRMYKKPLT